MYKYRCIIFINIHRLGTILKKIPVQNILLFIWKTEKKWIDIIEKDTGNDYSNNYKRHLENEVE